jgi:hypothetical protein
VGAKTTAGDVLQMVRESGQLGSENTLFKGEKYERWMPGPMLFEIASDFEMGEWIW